MPLKSYLENKKDIKTGIKCPQDKEELVRSLILKDCLEKLGCTYEKFKKTNQISKSIKKEEEDIF